MHKISEKKIKMKFFLLSFFALIIMSCTNENIDETVKKIDLPKAEKNISASAEEIKKNIETVVKVVTEKTKRSEWFPTKTKPSANADIVEPVTTSNSPLFWRVCQA